MLNLVFQKGNKKKALTKKKGLEAFYFKIPEFVFAAITRKSKPDG